MCGPGLRHPPSGLLGGTGAEGPPLHRLAGSASSYRLAETIQEAGQAARRQTRAYPNTAPAAPPAPAGHPSSGQRATLPQREDLAADRLTRQLQKVMMKANRCRHAPPGAAAPFFPSPLGTARPLVAKDPP